MKRQAHIAALMVVALVMAAGSIAAAQEKPTAKRQLPQNGNSNAPRIQRFMPIPITPAGAPTGGHYTLSAVVDGDTIPFYNLPEVNIYSDSRPLTAKEIRQNKKLINNVRLMLPYAQEGRRRLDALEIELAAIPKKERKAAIKAAEQKLLDDYKDEISNYTFSQGLVLIKLIDRETNRTAYTIVGELRGKLRAGLYQTMAKLFGYNLKDEFDPQHNKKDDLIDRIAIMIERGQL